MILLDGLYQVTTPYACFGFVIKNKQVTQAAHMFWKKRSYWIKIAVWIGV